MKFKCKTLFISDLHIGNPNCQADKILKLFKEYEFENLFIIGDCFDLTAMQRRFFWNQQHTEVIRKILKYSQKRKVVYILGNHDYYLRSLIEDGNIYIGNILLCDDFLYTTSTNEKIYITHGDCFDGFVRTSKFMYWLGDNAYEFSIKINKINNFIRKIFGLEYWSLSAYLKSKVKNVIKFLAEYKKLAIAKIEEKNCNSIMQGHTHSPEISKIGDNHFYNTGDFVESCSYMIEDYNGNILLKKINH